MNQKTYLILLAIAILVIAGGILFYAVNKIDDKSINIREITEEAAVQIGDKVYVAVEDDGVVAVVDPIKGNDIKNIDLSMDGHNGRINFMAHNVQVAPDGKSVWVTANVADDESMKDMGDDEDGISMNDGMGMMDDMMQINDEVIVIDPQTDSVVKRIDIAPELHLSHVAITPDNSYAIVASQEKGIIYKINAKTFKVENEVETKKGSAPHGLRIAPDGKVAYIAMLSGKSLGILDLSSFLLSYVPLNGSPVQTGVTPDGKYAMASVYDAKSLAVYDVQEKSVKYVKLPGEAKGPVQIYPSPDSRYVYVADQGYYFNQPNGKFVYKIDLEEKEVVGEIESGVAPHGIVVTKDGKFVYVTNILGEDVSVIDVDSGEKIKSIKVGNKPNGISVWSEKYGGTQ